MTGKAFAVLLLAVSLYVLAMLYMGQYDRREEAVEFCTWSVSSGIERGLGRGLTESESRQVEGTCREWYAQFQNGLPYESGEMYLGD